jgi:hypothetical protein
VGWGWGATGLFLEIHIGWHADDEADPEAHRVLRGHHSFDVDLWLTGRSTATVLTFAQYLLDEMPQRGEVTCQKRGDSIVAKPANQTN